MTDKKPFVHRPNSGSLFPNDRKESDNHPDYTGDCLVNGKEMRVSAWIKQGRKGEFYSLAFSEKVAKPKADAPANKPDDSEPPF